jgi:hypothetical protein
MREREREREREYMNKVDDHNEYFFLKTVLQMKSLALIK